jgi:hypothetical protein
LHVTRLVDEAATRAGVIEAFRSTFAPAAAGDTAVFYYSGHGSQEQAPPEHLPFEPDGLNETLVLVDSRAEGGLDLADKELAVLVREVSGRDVHTLVVLDCCHSGGLSRDGANKARGITAPDDIRHRELKWDAKRQVWIPRTLHLSKEKVFAAGEKERMLYTGEDGSTHRFGRSVPLWSDSRYFEKAKKQYGHKGAYMPLIIEACGEKQYSYEYRHGVTSYGAFTYSITTILRELNRKNKKVTYEQLMKLASERLTELEFAQTPVIVGPKEKMKQVVPLLAL